MTLHTVHCRIEVDGIVSEYGCSELGDNCVYAAPIFSLMPVAHEDHDACWDEDFASIPGCITDPFRWKPGTPALRFTSEGLQVS